MKKIYSLLLSIALLLNTAVLAAYASGTETGNNAGNDFERRQEVLIALDIMSRNSVGEIDNEKEITRAEFVDVLAKFINVNPAVVAEKSYFYDVPVDAWYTNSLNILTDLKIVSQNEQKLFEPDRAVTVDEAVKMMICLLGYRVFAESKGAYPTGYRAVGAELGLTAGMPGGSILTNAHMTVLLFNSLDIETASVDFSEGKATIKKNGSRILEANRDIYESDGIIEGIYGMSLDGTEVSERTDVIIDGEIYYSVEYERLFESFGTKIRFYYQENIDETYSLLYFEPFYENDCVKIAGEDFEKYHQDSNSVDYSVENKGKHAFLENDAVVMRNGEVVGTGVSEAFNISNGEIILVDSDNNKKYDLCRIYDFKTVVVNNVNTEDRILTYKLVSEPSNDYERENYNGIYDFSEKSVDCLSVFSSVGTVVDFAAVTQNSVLDIAVSAGNKSAVIYISSKIAEGTAEAFFTEDNRVKINGELYDIYPGVENIYLLKIGDSGKFKLNKYGKISYFEKVTSAGETNPAAYVINVNKTDTGEESYTLKYLDATGAIAVKNVSDKVRLDVERIAGDLFSELLKLRRSVVILSFNGSDEIIKIDSVNKGDKEDEDSLERLLEYMGQGTKWNSATKMFGKKVVCSQDAVVFIVPPNLPEYEDFMYDEQSYTIGSTSDLISNELNDVDCYKFGKTSYCNIIVLYKYKYQNPYRNRFLFVTDVSQALGSNDECVTRITGYQRGAIVSYDISNSFNVGDSPENDIVVGKGDIVTLGRKDGDGLVGNIEVHFDVSRNWSGLNQICLGGYMFDSYNNRNYDAIYYWLNTFTDLQAYTRFVCGCPTEIDGNLIKFSYPVVEGGRDSAGAYKWRRWQKPEDIESFDEIVILKSTTPILVYDVKSGKIEKGSVTDICTADTYDCPSQIFFDMMWGEVSSIFVINNNDDAWTKPDIVE